MVVVLVVVSIFSKMLWSEYLRKVTFFYCGLHVIVREGVGYVDLLGEVFCKKGVGIFYL